MAVELAHVDFFEYLKKGGMPTHLLTSTMAVTEMRKPQLIKLILQDHQDAIQELISLKVLPDEGSLSTDVETRD